MRMKGAFERVLKPPDVVFEATRKRHRDLRLGIKCSKCLRDNAPTRICHKGANKADNGDHSQDANMGTT
jgi:hypothetical protein